MHISHFCLTQTQWEGDLCYMYQQLLRSLVCAGVLRSIKPSPLHWQLLFLFLLCIYSVHTHACMHARRHTHMHAYTHTRTHMYSCSLFLHFFSFVYLYNTTSMVSPRCVTARCGIHFSFCCQTLFSACTLTHTQTHTQNQFSDFTFNYPFLSDARYS